MVITNLPDIKNRDYDILGLVEGTAVFAKHLGKDLMAGFKNMAGGELKAYTEMIDDAKKIALDRLIVEAGNIGADGVLNVQYSITNLQGGSSLVVIALGTGVKF